MDLDMYSQTGHLTNVTEQFDDIMTCAMIFNSINTTEQCNNLYKQRMSRGFPKKLSTSLYLNIN